MTKKRMGIIKGKNFGDKQKEKKAASEKLVAIIQTHSQQIALLRGAMLSVTGLIGVLLEEAKGPLSEDLAKAKPTLLGQLSQYQTLLTGIKDDDGNEEGK